MTYEDAELQNQGYLLEKGFNVRGCCTEGWIAARIVFFCVGYVKKIRYIGIK
jgi:hypothetical protein